MRYDRSVILSGDIGGTKTRLALVDAVGDGLEVAVEEVYRSGDHAGLVEIVRAFRRAHREPFERAGFGVAGPVRDGHVHATNLPWIVDARELAAELSLPNVALLNDLEAMANGVAALASADLVCLQRGAEDATGNRAVIAAGTGLGQAGLFWDGSEHLPLASEGGHADFAPADDLQDELVWNLRGDLGRVEVEHVLSGPGLVRIYRFLHRTGRGDEPDWLAKEIETGDPAAAISRAGMSARSKLAEDAVDLFVRIYGGQARNLALTILARGGVYLGGGIAPKMLSKLQGRPFLEAFLGGGALRLVLESMPVNVIVNEACPLFGAARGAVRIAEGAAKDVSRRDVRIFAGSAEVAKAAKEEFLLAAKSAIGARGRFAVALAGGNTPKEMYESLAGAEIDWKKVHLFFGDERCVPPDHPGSNYRMVREALISKVAIPEGNVHRVPTERASPARAAFEYEGEIREFFKLGPADAPRFDLVLLGMGADGHTASLFPGTAALTERERLVVAHWVPRLDSQRITLTLRALNGAAAVHFLVVGEEKAAAVRSVLQPAPGEAALPARLVHPSSGRLVWMLDRAAAAKLERKG
jgi:glucokinase